MDTTKKRLNFSLQMQEKYAIPLYKGVWPMCQLIEIDRIGLNEESIRLLDYNGIDKFVIISGLIYPIAQRFRTDDSGTDFSLRYKTGMGEEAEYFHLRRAIQSGSLYPKYYTFGIGDVEKGFRLFWIIDTKKMMDAEMSGNLKYMGPYRNYGRGASQVVFFSPRDIKPYVEFFVLP